jgi:hypothetical protein
MNLAPHCVAAELATHARRNYVPTMLRILLLAIPSCLDGWILEVTIKGGVTRT